MAQLIAIFTLLLQAYEKWQDWRDKRDQKKVERITIRVEKRNAKRKQKDAMLKCIDADDVTGLVRSSNIVPDTDAEDAATH